MICCLYLLTEHEICELVQSYSDILVGSDCFSLMNQALNLAEVFVGAPISCSCEFDVSFLLTADSNCVA